MAQPAVVAVAMAASVLAAVSNLPSRARTLGTTGMHNPGHRQGATMTSNLPPATARKSAVISNPPVTPHPASLHPDSPATAATVAVAVAVPAAARVALVAGATGLVGQEILARLLADKTYSAVHVAGRRAPAHLHPRLVVYLTESLSEFVAPPVDDVFIALGNTIKAAGNHVLLWGQMQPLS